MLNVVLLPTDFMSMMWTKRSSRETSSYWTSFLLSIQMTSVTLSSCGTSGTIWHWLKVIVQDSRSPWNDFLVEVFLLSGNLEMLQQKSRLWWRGKAGWKPNCGAWKISRKNAKILLNFTAKFKIYRYLYVLLCRQSHSARTWAWNSLSHSGKNIQRSIMTCNKLELLVILLAAAASTTKKWLTPRWCAQVPASGMCTMAVIR